MANDYAIDTREFEPLRKSGKEVAFDRRTVQPRPALINLRRKLTIPTVKKGFYEGFNPAVGVTAKACILILVFLLALFPDQAGRLLLAAKNGVMHQFTGWYVYLLAVVLVFCLAVAMLPMSGRVRLGPDGSRPKNSTLAWLSMMFCAGIGGGILSFSVSEPVSHFISNPEIIDGTIGPDSQEAVTSAVGYTYLHWGLSAWACYAIVGLALGLACHRYGQPLTMRSGLVPLFGRRLEGRGGHAIDTLSIVAITTGVTTTIVLGLEQICSGLSLLTGSTFFADAAGNAPLTGLLSALVVATGVAIASVLSGVDRGVKWISQIGVVLAFGVLATFITAGGGWQAIGVLKSSTIDYVTGLPGRLTTVYDPQLSQISTDQRAWQNDWTVFYWAWWIAFAPFIGLFLTRVSYGRTVREFILGAMLAPTAMCFMWFAGTGGTALLMETGGQADGRIVSAEHAFRIYEAIDVILTPAFGQVIKSLLILLFLVLIVASSTAAIIAIKAIGAAGNELSEMPTHSIVWAFVIAALTAAILSVGGIDLIRYVMIIGALPFSIIMALMMGSVVLIYMSESKGRLR